MKEESRAFFRELEILMLLTLFTGLLAIGVIFQDLKILLSFFTGAFLGYLNFTTLKKEGTQLLQKVYQNVMACHERPYQKERTFFLVKAYLRLLALGILLYFVIKYLKFHPVFILVGFSLVYLQIFLVIFKYWYTKRETFLRGG